MCKGTVKKEIPCAVFSRVVGYYSNVWGNWNKGKQQEFKDRRVYDVKGYRPKEAESNQTIPA